MFNASKIVGNFLFNLRNAQGYGCPFGDCGIISAELTAGGRPLKAVRVTAEVSEIVRQKGR